MAVLVDSDKSAAPKLWLRIAPGISSRLSIGKCRVYNRCCRNGYYFPLGVTWPYHVQLMQQHHLPVANTNQRVPVNTGVCEPPTPQIMLPAWNMVSPYLLTFPHPVPIPTMSPSIHHLGPFFRICTLPTIKYPQSSLFIFPLDDPTRE
jgi:hypothetical protein